LGLNTQKSLFKKNNVQEDLSQSIISQDSEYTVSECSSPRKRKNSNFEQGIFNMGEEITNFKIKVSS